MPQPDRRRDTASVPPVPTRSRTGFATRAAWLWIAVLHVVLLWLYHWPDAKPWLGDEGTYWRVANAWSRGELAELPRLWPPLYPAFAAGVLRVSGGSLWAIQGVQLALLAATAWLVRDTCRRLHTSDRVANLTGFLMLGFPPLAAFAGYLRPEILHGFWFALALWILTARRTAFHWLVLFGIALGLALLTKTLLAPFIAVLLVPLVADGAPRDRALRLGFAVAAIALTIAPTVVSNAQRTGTPGIANSGWFNLWVGINDTSRRNLRQPVVGREFRIFEESAPTFAERNAVLRRKIGDRVEEVGVPALLAGQLGRQYFRLLDKDSYLTDQLPGGVIAVRGSGYRDVPPWLGATLRFASYAMYAVVLVGAVAGIAWCSPGTRRWMWIPLAFLAYNGALFLLLHAKSRYRLPLLPFLFFYAACAVDRWMPNGGRDAEPLGHRSWRWAATLAGSAVVLWLAFAASALDGR